ncbi:MAG: PEP-CTERM sorting domain-containing protein [Colwellia sp.]|nr:PEP-CTERM sorting domain-containing protein [Colwellia sp.]
MLNTMKKKLAAVAVLTAIALPAAASVVTVTDGVTPYTFDQLVVTTEGDSLITQTFVDGTNDTFTEIGLTAVATFKNAGGTVGFPTTYDLIFNIDLVGTAATTETFAGSGIFDIDVTFGNTSVSTLIHDDVPFGGLDGTSTPIATLSGATGGCDLQVTAANPTVTTNNGTCNVSFDFDALVAGWFTTSWGEDFTTLTNTPTIDFSLDIDITAYDVDSPAPGITTIMVAHDGSAVINVPEPTSIAILGLGLLGLAGARRRKS